MFASCPSASLEIIQISAATAGYLVEGLSATFTTPIRCVCGTCHLTVVAGWLFRLPLSILWQV